MIKKNIIVNNLNITYYQSSTPQSDGALVFLHGWQSQSLHLKNILDRVDNYIAIDLPGFGLSERPTDVWGLLEYANFLKEILQKLSLNNPILIGHSVGGSIIIKYLSLGGTAKKIILIDSAGIRNQTLVKKTYGIVAKILKPIFFVLPHKFSQSLRYSLYKTIGAEDYVEAGPMTETYKKIIAENLLKELNKIDIQTLLIWGANDKATPVTQAKIINKAIANSKLLVIPDAGHFPFVDQPLQFMRIFLNEVREINVN